MNVAEQDRGYDVLQRMQTEPFRVRLRSDYASTVRRIAEKSRIPMHTLISILLELAIDAVEKDGCVTLPMKFEVKKESILTRAVKSVPVVAGMSVLLL